MARNITTYATRGEVLLSIVATTAAAAGSASSRATEGPGIADVERAMQDGYTTGAGSASGLPGARRLVDDFAIDTAPGQGRR